MVLNFLEIVNNLGPYTMKTEPVKNDNHGQTRTIYLKGDKAFLVVNKNTIELRTDRQLATLLMGKYESVMRSRYFGLGGIEIVLANQLHEDEIKDLIRLSYDMT